MRCDVIHYNVTRHGGILYDVIRYYAIPYIVIRHDVILIDVNSYDAVQWTYYVMTQYNGRITL
jgi:hypothetical protein